ncbi:MAG: GFA family protein [Gammaproteobacteria bacterium]|nr:MAG: GFA family protein [Gammaproteobacteria bacterium]TDJ42130.1 MAG: GFA family protein [Gammaproteobacteria bacterium]
MIRGSCLCRGVTFQIDGKYSDISHCHCSKCRKVSGANSNAWLTTAANNFTWSQGADLVKNYEMPDGWMSTFCRECGSPLPMCGAKGKLYWVPTGALDDDPQVPVAQHIFVASKGSWEVIGGEAPQYPEEIPNP